MYDSVLGHCVAHVVIYHCTLYVCLQETQDAKGPSYTAIYDFTGQDGTQLTFKKGETVCPIIGQKSKSCPYILPL